MEFIFNDLFYWVLGRKCIWITYYNLLCFGILFYFAHCEYWMLILFMSLFCIENYVWNNCCCWANVWWWWKTDGSNCEPKRNWQNLITTIVANATASSSRIVTKRKKFISNLKVIKNWQIFCMLHYVYVSVCIINHLIISTHCDTTKSVPLIN